MYTQIMEVRWNDMDANAHLANSAYVQMGANARLGFFNSLGLTMDRMKHLQLGPIIFQEQLFYFQEAHLGEELRITVALSGLSNDGRFFETHQEFYNATGDNLARILLTGGFMDLNARKISPLPAADIAPFWQIEKTDDFKILTSADTRKWGQHPRPWS